ncbi:uncharacterized protein LOC110924058 [Helianthus annuus]|uniref:uncharacterized protein LOC110924058 n=1 Tax=Helianthus annuus TaxID=4232 RepID=UPI000B8F9FD6|nr:uncharacterized protein LOC110924058 [Helianthus annuus]
MARDCKKKGREEGNVAVTEDEEGWNVDGLLAQDYDQDFIEEHAFTVSVEPQVNKLDDWIVDSGCSNHMTGERGKLSNPTKYSGNSIVVIADNSRHNIESIGDVVFPSKTEGKELVLTYVYHVPGMRKNLLSVPQMTDAGKYVVFGPNDVRVFEKFETPSKPILQGHRRESVYVLSAETTYVEKTKNSQIVDLWHQRLGHVGYEKLGIIMKKDSVVGLPKLEVNKDEKSEALAKFKEFRLEAERVTGRKIKCLRSDNGGEYTSQEFASFLKSCKIGRQLTCANTPQQNGVSERKNRHLQEVSGSLLHNKNIPQRFWAESIRIAAYIINRTPQQSFSHLRQKLDKKAVRCIFVGYDEERKGWKCCDSNTGKCLVLRHVVFDENSAWWSRVNDVLPDTEDLTEKLKTSFVNLTVEDDPEVEV